ncbi:hypothetical protein BAP_2282 [Bacillus sp. CN2]|nr:hypothetical protein BCBMB205_27970 [Bacillus velezensis]ARZ59143.1 hypothetical protein BAGQ_2913 [Bacillus velezensis]GFR55576.1 hypothetical protein BAP_2282 [Bacillus sp. CN2]
MWIFITIVSKKYYQQLRGFKLLLDEVMEELKEVKDKH